MSFWLAIYRMLMMGKKEQLAHWLESTGLLAYTATIRNRTSRFVSLPILAYHRALNFNPQTYPFDPDVISASVEAFDQQMAYIKKNFNVITFEMLQESRENGIRLERPMIITFDDGYRDNYLNAYPILKRHGIPATFFLAVSYIGTKEVFHWEKIVYLILQTQKDYFSLESDRGRIKYAVPPGDRTSLIKEMQTVLKRVSPLTAASIIKQMEAELKVDHYKAEHVTIMTWEEVLEMAKNGMEIGSHGLRHINITKTSDMELQEEIVDSKKRIEKEIGRRVSVLAYPFGQADHFDERVKGAAEQAGYQFACSYIHGADALWNKTLDCFALKRLHVESSTTLNYFKAMLAFPSLF